MTAAGPRPRVLIIDDDRDVVSSLARVLRDCDVTTAGDARAAMAALDAAEFGFVLCDVMMPELTGMDVYLHVAARDQRVADAIVFMTGGVYQEREREFLNGISNVILRKPVDPHDLRSLIAHRHERAL
ncbi:MAG TPA: response regulator [Kofleriaceae bacterium]|nr:response regulator [Kofleriaceae bacterium]